MISIFVAIKKKKKYQQRDPRGTRNTIFSFISFSILSPPPTQSPVIKHRPSELFLSVSFPFPPPLRLSLSSQTAEAVKQRRRVELTACVHWRYKKARPCTRRVGRNVFVPFANKARRVEQIILQRRPGLYSTWPARARLKRFVGETWGET